MSAVEVARPADRPPQCPLNLKKATRPNGGRWLLRMVRHEIEVDQRGAAAAGEIAIRAENWPEMLAMAERAGLITEGARRTAEGALGFLAGLSGRRENLDVTLRLEDGFLFLGPLPVGEGPRFRLR